jgi:methyl-accepting chemotaxis protein
MKCHIQRVGSGIVTLLEHTIMFSNINVAARLFILTALASIITIIVVLFGVFGMNQIKENVHVMYNERAAALSQLGKVNSGVSVLALHMYRALQHDPSTPLIKLHADHSVDVHVDAAEKLIKDVEEAWDTYTATPLDETEKAAAAKFKETFGGFVGEAIRPTIASLRAGDYSPEVYTHFIMGYRKFGLPVVQLSNELVETNGKLAKENYEHSEAVYDSSLMTMLTVFFVGLALSVFVAWSIIRSIVIPLSGLQTTIAGIEHSGDFTQRAEVFGKNEIGHTATAFNKLLATLQKALGEILADTTQLDTAATALATTAQQVAASSEMTSESSSAMAAAVEEMTVSVATINQNAQETTKLTREAGEMSQKGADVIRRTVGEMHTVAEAVSKSSGIITELGQQSEKISGIVQVIKDVADQTNLLALNAAIEAARAGEQGRGFAVVADEVRKLAERTTSATGEIGAMISAIQGSSQSAVGAMSNAASRVESGVKLADEAGEAITIIQQGAGQVEAQVSEVTLVLAEQGTTSQSIAQQVERVAQAAEENSAAARGSSESAKNIENLARAMRKTVSQFKV